ncbi:MAG: hypothetical protein ACFFB3_05440 [Candidatus Hodarchaeota archaeon]
MEDCGTRFFSIIYGYMSLVGVTPPEAVNPQPFFDELKKQGIEMIYDDKGKPEILGIPTPYRPGFFATYGLTFLTVLTLILALAQLSWLAFILLS